MGNLSITLKGVQKLLEKINISKAEGPDLKGNAAYLKKKYIMDENDSLSEYFKIPLGHNHTNGAVYSKINFKVDICSAL